MLSSLLFVVNAYRILFIYFVIFLTFEVPNKGLFQFCYITFLCFNISCHNCIENVIIYIVILKVWKLDIY